jgi:hypothetical protein
VIEFLQTPLITNPIWASFTFALPALALLLTFSPANRIRKNAFPVIGTALLLAVSLGVIGLAVHAWDSVTPPPEPYLTWGDALLSAAILIGAAGIVLLERAWVRVRVEATLLTEVRHPTGIRLMGVAQPGTWRRIYQAALEHGQAHIDTRGRGDVASVTITINNALARGNARAMVNGQLLEKKPLEAGHVVLRVPKRNATLEFDVGMDTVVVPLREVAP